MAHPTESRVFKAGWRCFCYLCRTAIDKGTNCKVIYINRKCKLCVHEKCADYALTKSKSPRPCHLKHKRVKIRNLSKNIPLDVLEKRIEEMAELENAMVLYEHSVEAG